MRFVYHATKVNLKSVAGFLHWILLKTTYLTNLKCDVDKLHIDEMRNVPTNLSNLKSKVDT